jgi:hypothetical protein
MRTVEGNDKHLHQRLWGQEHGFLRTAELLAWCSNRHNNRTCAVSQFYRRMPYDYRFQHKHRILESSDFVNMISFQSTTEVEHDEPRTLEPYLRYDMQAAPRRKVVLTDEKAAEIYVYKLATLRSGLSKPKNYSQVFLHTESPKIKGQSTLVAQQYAVSPKTIRDIWNRKTWANATRHLWSSETVVLNQYQPTQQFHQALHLISNKVAVMSILLDICRAALRSLRIFLIDAFCCDSTLL